MYVRQAKLLESLRFDKKFNFRFFIEPDIKSSEIFLPPLLIQPYLENAIWHGLMQKESHGNLELKIIKRGNIINIIENLENIIVKILINNIIKQLNKLRKCKEKNSQEVLL